MKFQDSSFNCLKVTVGTKSVTHPRSKAICPINFFKVGGIMTGLYVIKSSHICDKKRSNIYFKRSHS